MNPDEMFLAWFSGLVDGEGCFYVHIMRVRGCTNFRPTFQLALRADDAPIVFEIADKLGIGSVYKFPSRHPNHAPMINISVFSLVDCQGLVQILDEYPLRTRKLQDYLIWREAVQEFARKPVNKQRMDILRERLMLIKRFDQSGIPDLTEEGTSQLSFWENEE